MNIPGKGELDVECKCGAGVHVEYVEHLEAD